MKKNLKLTIIYIESAITGCFVGIGIYSLLGWWGVPIAILLAILHVHCMIMAVNMDKIKYTKEFEDCIKGINEAIHKK